MNTVKCIECYECVSSTMVNVPVAAHCRIGQTHTNPRCTYARRTNECVAVDSARGRNMRRKLKARAHSDHWNDSQIKIDKTNHVHAFRLCTLYLCDSFAQLLRITDWNSLLLFFCCCCAPAWRLVRWQNNSATCTNEMKSKSQIL